MAITYNHAVKYKGKYYPPNTPIVEEVAKEPEKDEAKKKAAPAKKVKKDGESE